MQKITFENDHFSRKAIHYFLLFQIIAMVLVFILIALHLYSLALIISISTLLIFIAIFLWIYFYYQRIPVVKEKRNLKQTISLLQKSINEEEDTIRTTKKKRERLCQDEQKENSTALINLQQDYIKNGLLASNIKDAVISGIGPKLKERLAENKVFTAADITKRISAIPGFGEVKLSALLGWKLAIYTRLDKTKPAKLSSQQLEFIKRKYWPLFEDLDTNEKKAQDNQKKILNDLNSLKLRLKQLKPITFTAYLGNSISSQGNIAAFIAFILVSTQAVSGVSATTSAIIASIPTATATPTITLTPTHTFTPTNTYTPTYTSTSTITLTPTITNTPTETYTPLPTRTRIPSITPTRPIPASNSLQGVTAICNDGWKSYSQHRRGTCSHHGGVKEWINRPPD